jgi:hypothetical protein
MKKYHYAEAVVEVMISLDTRHPEGNEVLLQSMRGAQHFCCTHDVAERLTDDTPEVRATELRLPFPNVYIEMGTEAIKDVHCLGFFFHQHMILLDPKDQGIEAEESALWAGTMLVFHKDGSTQMVATTTVFASGAQYMQVQGGDDPSAPPNLEKVLQTEFARAIVVLNATTEGVLTPYLPSKFRRRMKSRKKHHKLVEYKVLKLDLKRLEARKEAQGGHHASPRLHVRRGHWRAYKDGHKKWIKPMWVGDKEAGMVQKDYEIA